MTLPSRANSVGGARRRQVGVDDARPGASGKRLQQTRRAASITALIPVVVARMHRQPFLDRAQPRLGEVLRRAPARRTSRRSTG